MDENKLIKLCEDVSFIRAKLEGLPCDSRGKTIQQNHDFTVKSTAILSAVLFTITIATFILRFTM